MIRMVGLFLLLLLKILGWALLVLLLLLIAVVLLVLFVPVRYEVRVQNERSTEPEQNNPIAELRMHLKVNWLLHLLHVTVSYGPEGMQNKIRVVGIDLKKVLTQLAERKEEKQKRRERKKHRRTVQESHNTLQTKDSAVKPDETEQMQTESENRIFSDVKAETGDDSRMPEESIGETKKVPSAEAESGSDEKEQTLVLKDSSEESRSQAVRKVQEPQRKKDISEPVLRKHEERSKKENRKRASGSSEPGIITKIRTQLSRLHKEFTDEVNRNAVSHLWKELLKLLCSYKPRKLKADLTFSLADPALTGGAVGMISLLPWIYRYPCSIIPDFTSEKLYIEGEVLACGKVTVFVFAVSLLRLLRDKDFMQAVRRVMKRDRS